MALKLDPKEREELRFWKKVVAIFLIFIGIMGIILPIMPGWPFIFWGLFILGGLGLIDRTILRFLPKKYREKVNKFLEKYLGRWDKR